MPTLVVPGVSVEARFDVLPPLPAPSGIVGAVGIVDRPAATGLVGVSKSTEVAGQLGPGTETTMPEVIHALANGASEVVISAVDGGSRASVTLFNSTNTATRKPALTLRTRSNGGWGNQLAVEVRGIADSTGKIVRVGLRLLRGGRQVEQFSDLQVAPGMPDDLFETLNRRSRIQRNEIPGSPVEGLEQVVGHARRHLQIGELLDLAAATQQPETDANDLAGRVRDPANLHGQLITPAAIGPRSKGQRRLARRRVGRVEERDRRPRTAIDRCDHDLARTVRERVDDLGHRRLGARTELAGDLGRLRDTHQTGRRGSIDDPDRADDAGRRRQWRQNVEPRFDRYAGNDQSRHGTSSRCWRPGSAGPTVISQGCLAAAGRPEAAPLRHRGRDSDR